MLGRGRPTCRVERRLDQRELDNQSSTFLGKHKRLSHAPQDVDHNDGRNHRQPVPPFAEREGDDGRHDENRDLDARTFQSEVPLRGLAGPVLQLTFVPIDKLTVLGPPRPKPSGEASSSTRRSAGESGRHHAVATDGRAASAISPTNLRQFRAQLPSELAHPGRRNPERAGHAARCLTENQFFSEPPVPVRQR